MPDLRLILQNALKAGVAIPAFNVPYLPMIEPVAQAVADQNSFAMIETARLEWLKRTGWLISEYFCLDGIQPLVTQETP